MRQRKLLAQKENAHDMNIKSLVLDPNTESFLFSGSTDGCVKVWSLPSLELKENWVDQHKTKSFIRKNTKQSFFTHNVSTYGVMEVILTDGNILTCGSDACLNQRNYHIIAK